MEWYVWLLFGFMLRFIFTCTMLSLFGAVMNQLLIMEKNMIFRQLLLISDVNIDFSQNPDIGFENRYKSGYRFSLHNPTFNDIVYACYRVIF